LANFPSFWPESACPLTCCRGKRSAADSVAVFQRNG
jgi:hypothetical protein